ncbi:hypothetical protein NO357_02070 [Marimonas arenosa]|uniref:DUF2059 domain-containing protein n=2 Tax=Marimonas arenosa TaxID=1795305 RepID=A0AAE3WA19_9RHOB|nr:hypothetical protein [Marimonas arenosa]
MTGILTLLAAVCMSVASGVLPERGAVRAETELGVEGQATEWRRLSEAIAVPELLEVMRIEGVRYGDEIGAEFLADGGGSWQAVVARIYDRDKMLTAVMTGLKGEIADEQLAELNVFFASERGRQIVRQEILAREAFLDPATEEAARTALAEAEGAAETDAATARRLELLQAYVDENDLVDFNVAGALTSNYRFYRGLADGGGWTVSEDEMLAEVWAQEDEIRVDTTEWLMAYLLMAYAPLSDGDIEAYVALSKTPAGRALNRGLFAGFDRMYADLSYALGLAAAVQMQGEDL